LICRGLELACDEVVLTSTFERQSFGKRHITIIPVPTNMGDIADFPRGVSRKGVVYFSALGPRKGVEEVLKISEDLDQSTPLIIIGSLGANDFAWQRDLARANPNVTWVLNASQKLVRETLGGAQICLLPYPDGLSDRRATFVTAIFAGASILTNFGSATPKALQKLERVWQYELGDTEDLKNKLSQTLEASNCVDDTYESHRIEFIEQRRWSNVISRYQQVINRFIADQP
jgi:glycosyltransferase involved in cell wall biosynthesis